MEIPRGRFIIGTNESGSDEYPPHPVTFDDPFYLGATEVTFDQYDLFCGLITGCDPPDDQNGGRGDRPVINVNWHDARRYVRWLSATTGRACRLPSEAEWEYAARSGTTTEYALPAPDGSNDIKGKGLANCEGCGGEWDDKDRTAPVRSFDQTRSGDVIQFRRQGEVRYAHLVGLAIRRHSNSAGDVVGYSRAGCLYLRIQHLSRFIKT